MQGRKKLRGTTLVLHVSFKAVSNHEGSKQPPYMAFSEGGLGETALWPPKSGFPQKTLFLKETRLHSADIGAARRGLNVLASACSGAMFPRVPPPPFTFRGSLWAFPARYSPFPRMYDLSYCFLPGLSRLFLLWKPYCSSCYSHIHGFFAEFQKNA